MFLLITVAPASLTRSLSHSLISIFFLLLSLPFSLNLTLSSLIPYSSNLKVLAIATMASPPSAFVAPGRLQVPDDIGGVRKLTSVI